jgi:hypothetical protein
MPPYLVQATGLYLTATYSMLCLHSKTAALHNRGKGDDAVRDLHIEILIHVFRHL